MSRDSTLLTSEHRDALEGSILDRLRLEEQFDNLDQQHRAATLGM
jgi:hypothetical protein